MKCSFCQPLSEQDSDLRIGECGEAENLSQFLARERRSHAEVNF